MHPLYKVESNNNYIAIVGRSDETMCIFSGFEDS